MRLVKKMVSGFINLTAAVVLVLVIALIAVIIAGYRPYVVLSGSMEPIIKTGSLCFIDTGYNYDDLQEGDIIAFSNGRISVTHRVHEIRDGLIRTKGDANDEPDQYFISEGNFLGLTVQAVPYAGYVVTWLQKAQGRILVVTGMIFLVLLEAFLSQFGDKKDKESEKKENEEWPI